MAGHVHLKGAMDDIAILLEELASARAMLDEALRRNALERQRGQACCSDLSQTMLAIRSGRMTKTAVPGRVIEAQLALQRLTAREREVLRLIAEGYSTKQIAGELRISFKTAVSHRTNILEKLNIHESATLVRLAVTAGLVAA